MNTFGDKFFRITNKKKKNIMCHVENHTNNILPYHKSFVFSRFDSHIIPPLCNLYKWKKYANRIVFSAIITTTIQKKN